MENTATDKKQVMKNIVLIIQGILVSASFCIIHNLKTSSILSFVLFAMYVMLYQKSERNYERKEKIVKIILSALFSFFTALGEILVILDSGFAPSWVITFAICWLGQFFLMELVVGSLLVVFRKNYFIVNMKNVSSDRKITKVFAVCFLVLIAIWGIGWIRVYPGSMSRDSIQIANMALGNIDLLAAVPIVYVYPIRLVWNIGKTLFGTDNAGLGLCTFVQLTGMAVIVAYSISRLYANSIKKWICVLTLLYFAFMPYNVYMVTTIWKDVPFAASMLLFMVLLVDFYLGKREENRIKEYSRLFFFILAGMGVCLMRNNGLFAFILFVPFGLFLFYKKNKKVFISLMLIFVLTRIVQGPVYDKIMTAHAEKRTEQKAEEIEKAAVEDSQKEKKVKNATDSYNASAIYIITAQQLANVAADRNDLSAEDYERLNKVINVEKVRANYAEKSDYCRRCIDITLPLIRYKVPEAEYLKTWVYFGMKYPINYILGWRGQTIGYWYPDIQNWTTIDAIIENDIGIYKVPVLDQAATDKIVHMENSYKKIPVYGMLWSIGFMVWLNLFFAGVTYIKKGIKGAMLYIMHIGVWLTLLVATPIYAEFRYAYSLFLCMPLSILIPFMGDEDKVVR